MVVVDVIENTYRKPYRDTITEGRATVRDAEYGTVLKVSRDMFCIYMEGQYCGFISNPADPSNALQPYLKSLTENADNSWSYVIVEPYTG